MSVTKVSPVELPSAAAKMTDASGWWTVAYAKDRPRADRIVEAVVVRGWSGQRQFMAVWVDGKADCAYWWTRQHEATAQLPTEVVRWETPVPTPVKVPFAELKRLVSNPPEVR